MTIQAPKAKRNYKDTVFRRLFSDKNNLLSLYNAVNGTAYTDPGLLENITLENVIYMSMKNDLAFLIDFQMNLYEHQSTVNPNMPIRFLQYTAKEYEKILDSRALYSGKQLFLPAPHYVVFYNGTRMQPAEQILRLSDSYTIPESHPQLELEVRFININEDAASPLLKKCKILREYTCFIDTIRSFSSKMELSMAVNCAVETCINEDILKDFLIKNKAEVIAMSILECDFEDVKEAIKEYAWESGLNEGLVEGHSHINALNRLLIRDNRMDDLIRSTSDAAFQEQLIKEYHI